MDRRTAAVWTVLLAATAGRLIIAARVPLVDDEAYYWAWAQRLAWGYPDHPPAIAGLIRATTAFLGDSPLGVRLGPVLLNLGVAWLLLDLGRLMFGAKAGALAALWYQSVPLFSIGAIFAVPDAPFVFSWMLALWALWRARSGRHPGFWLLAGVAVGLAALSKLTAGFLALSLTGYLLWGETDRSWWRRWEPYAAAALAIALALPVAWWNAAHNGTLVAKALAPIPWITLGAPAINALAYTGAQLAYYGPISAGLLLAALAACWRKPRAADARYVYCLWAAVPIIGVLWAASFDGIPKPHWPAPGFVVALVPAAALWPSLRRRPRWRRAGDAAVAINILLVGSLAGLALWPATPAAAQLRAWDQIVPPLHSLIEATPESPGRFILAPGYQAAAQVEYHLPGYVVATPFGGDAYSLWVPLQRIIDWNGIYFTDGVAPGLPLTRMFRRVEALPPITIDAPGGGNRTFFVYRGLGFRGFPRPAVFPI